MTFVDDPQHGTEVVLKKRARHSLTLTSIKDEANGEEVDEEDNDDGRLVPSKSDLDFQVLRLDLKMGHQTSSTASSLVSQLEKSSIANLLEGRIGASLSHLDKLRKRIEDTSSKVLVTGDLNAGKSTLVNALLRRSVMPVDQQPCTTAFTEVHDVSENDGKEEVHLVTIADSAKYSVKDETTFKRLSVQELEEFMGENEDEKQIVKLYIKDLRAAQDSLLNNGIADISLIDAPGLNRDSVKTTALFARQEEIDVVVFVVSAENHFTLSAKEFLETASREKAYVFMVVNKFEGIRNKDKCKRLVLDQIKQLSPRTYDDAADLVHFVDSATVLGVESTSPSFQALESSLRSFVLLKRAKSKLHPAATFLTHLLADVDLLAGANAILAKAELGKAKEDLNRTRPVLEKMKNSREGLDESLEQVEEEGTSTVRRDTRALLNAALERVGAGEIAVEQPLVPMPAYPGLLRIWDYIHDVRKALLSSLDEAARLAEDESRIVTAQRVKDIQSFGDRFLPEGAERSRRVFMPEAMFARKGRHGKSSPSVVAGGVYGLGIGLSQRPEMLETSFLDLFDIHHHLDTYFGNNKEPGKEHLVEDESYASALSIVSVSAGALAVVGGPTLGVRNVIEGIVRVTDLLSNEAVRKWAAPVLGVVTVGAAAYLIYELPFTVPRTVGRRLCNALTHVDDEQSYVGAHALRISRETRKVLRIASYDQRSCFQGAMEARVKEVEEAERVERQAGDALVWLQKVQVRTGEIRGEVCAAGDL